MEKMREILFEAKARDNKQWVCWDKFGRLIEEVHVGTFVYNKGCPISQVPIIESTTREYTGLNDKNGKRIFEGDIISRYGEFGVVKFGTFELSNWGFPQQGFYVEWVNRNCCLSNSLVKATSDVSPCKIIGNIFDNPELLEEKK